MAKKKPEVVKESKGEWQYEKIASILGKWAWVILILNAVIYLIVGIVTEILAAQTAATLCATYWIGPTPCPWMYTVGATSVWQIIGAIVTVLFAIIIVKPRFSNKCAAQEWDILMDDVLVVGGVRIPWMFIWCIITAIFGQGWGTFPILIPAILLIFAGPKPYEWKE